ncbi:helix-turn-helix transcriptional regulator [Holdemania massiliensis]|uniref:helix-turn-helix transcriptional regulator n=1 Tax=Holdemania massiliensis TaxID=1468449 RepID=UPI001F0656B5|nr:helix-turn-helix transcriptional regulator [Holdemania massiliensis]MCH1941620.1 helix-turn-helix domain-containing protein [Holdemania massiliensis]
MIELTVEQARKVSGISQKEMAKILNISENAYINKEKGVSRFYVDEACRFAEAVNLPLETIKFF